MKTVLITIVALNAIVSVVSLSNVYYQDASCTELKPQSFTQGSTVTSNPYFLGNVGFCKVQGGFSSSIDSCNSTSYVKTDYMNDNCNISSIQSTHTQVTGGCQNIGTDTTNKPIYVQVICSNFTYPTTASKVVSSSQTHFVSYFLFVTSLVVLLMN